MENEKISRKMKIFYEDFADRTFKFNDGKTIKISLALLSVESAKLHRLFLNSKPTDSIKIPRFDYCTFKLFLDCFMGFQECSVAHALKIFPVAWHYKTDKFSNKCLDILKPVAFNKNVCLALNVALSCKCEALKEAIINFLKERYLLCKLFSDQAFYFLLEPESVSELLKYIKIDSHVVENLFTWAENYLKSKDEAVDYKNFFLRHGILDKLTVGCFETSKSLARFSKSDRGKNFFALECFLTRLESFDNDNRDSAWFDMKAGETLCEKFVVKQVGLWPDLNSSLRITRNKLVLYSYPEKDSKDKKLLIYDLHMRIIGNDEYYQNETRHARIVDALLDTAGFNLKIKCEENGVYDVEIERRIFFHFNCRILKKSPSNFEPVDKNAKNLYFIDRIEYRYDKKNN